MSGSTDAAKSRGMFIFVFSVLLVVFAVRYAIARWPIANICFFSGLCCLDVWCGY